MKKYGNINFKNLINKVLIFDIPSLNRNFPGPREKIFLIHRLLNGKFIMRPQSKITTLKFITHLAVNPDQR